MKTLFSSVKLKLRQIVTVTLASLLLLISTACSNPADAQAANPNNQPVQMGGMNNPYKNGGDKYTENKNDSKQSSIISQQLIAATEAELLYPGAETPQGRAIKEAEMPIINEKSFQPKPGGTIQRESNVGERFKDRIETVKESVGEASAFLKDKAEEASARPELQKNPAVGK